MYFTLKLFIRNQIRCGAAASRAIADYSADTLLSQDNLMRAASKFEGLPLIRMQTEPSQRKAAVLIPLCEVDDKVSLLFTLRTTSMRSHKGQVSYPGGMQDVKDKTLRGTALRETKEELGIEPGFVTIWGQGQPIVARGETSVVPVIGTVAKDLSLETLQINPQEVELAFTVPIEELCRPDKVKFTQFKTGYTTPCFFAGDKRIWGLTAIITHAFLKCLVPGNGYQPKIKFIPAIRSNARATTKLI